MTIQAFTKEIEDGLQAQLSNNTIAFNCSLSKSDVPTDVTLKSVAAFKDGRNFDLYYLQAILASVGPNKNDDWFLPEEVWAARETPIHKQLNYMHNEKDIIGVITDSILLDAQGNTIFADVSVPSIKDIATQAVIWTHWEDQVMTDKVDKIIASIEENKLFVSMEALFKKFDYMIVKNGQSEIIERTEATSFLTKYLRSFGGDGLYEGNSIYRVLRDFTFSGKGIVSDPANPRSIIDDSLFVSNPTQEVVASSHFEEIISTQAENIMEEELKKEIAELKAALAKANETVAAVKSAEASKATAELEDLKAQVTALKTLAADTKAKMDEMEKDCAEKMDSKDKEAKDKMDEAEARVVAAEAKLAEVLAEKIVAERCSQLIAENVDADEAKALVKTFASLNDELFSQVVAIHKKSVKTEKTQATTSSETVEDAIDQAKASQKADAKITEVEVSDDEMTALSKSIASKLFTKKTTKGDK